MGAPGPDVTHLNQEIAAYLGLYVKAELLGDGRTIALIDDCDGPLRGRRVNGELWKRKIRPERVRETGGRVRHADQLADQGKGRAGGQLDKGLAGSAAIVDAIA